MMPSHELSWHDVAVCCERVEQQPMNSLIRQQEGVPHCLVRAALD